VALPATARVVIEVIASDRRPVSAMADGRHVASVERVEVAYGDAEVELAWFEDHAFTAHLIDKILKP
jgi:hypothetical protein